MSSIGWKNLTSAVSDASPMVGLSSHGTLLKLAAHFSDSLANLASFSSSFKALLFLILITFSWGKLLSKTALELDTAH